MNVTKNILFPVVIGLGIGPLAAFAGTSSVNAPQAPLASNSITEFTNVAYCARRCVAWSRGGYRHGYGYGYNRVWWCSKYGNGFRVYNWQKAQQLQYRGFYCRPMGGGGYRHCVAWRTVCR